MLGGVILTPLAFLGLTTWPMRLHNTHIWILSKSNNQSIMHLYFSILLLQLHIDTSNKFTILMSTCCYSSQCHSLQTPALLLIVHSGSNKSFNFITGQRSTWYLCYNPWSKTIISNIRKQTKTLMLDKKANSFTYGEWGAGGWGERSRRI